MLATLTAEAFDDPEWGYEPKWDGIRAIAMCDEETRLITRNDKDVTVAYPELRRMHEQTVAFEAMLDGEIVAFDKGVPSFQRLQQRMHLRDERKIEEMARQIPVVYLVFDVLYIDGEDLTDQPLEERRRILDESIVPSDQIQVSPVTQGKGKALYKAAEKQGLEGIMAKRLSSVYQPGERSKDWLKVKVTFDADVVIVGWTEGEGSRVGSLGSLMMAVYDDGVLRYVGNVGTGFKTRSLPDIFDQLKALTETKPPFPYPSRAATCPLGQTFAGGRGRASWCDVGGASQVAIVPEVPRRQETQGVHLRLVVARLTTTGILGRCRAITTTPATAGRISWAISHSVGFRQQSAPGWCWRWSILC